MNSDTEKYTVRAVDRALDIIRCLADDEEPLTVDQISARAGLPKTTAFRVLATLESRGFVIRDPIRQTYGFGEMALLVGARALGRSDVRSVARPYLEQLMDETGETVHLSILNSNSALCIDKIDSRRSVSMLSYVGFRDPLYCSGVGKTLLAYQPEAAREAIMANLKLTRRTEYTIVDVAALRDHLEIIRQQGYALDLGEIEVGLTCVAAPILGDDNEIIAAISISGPDARFDEEARRTLVPNVISKAQRISQALGFSSGREAK